MESEVQIVRAILRQNEFLLRRHLVLSRTVLDKMKANGLITDVMRRKISMEAPNRQVGVLINCLEHKGIQSLRKFLDTLRSTGHSWIVDHILDTDITHEPVTKGPRDRNYQPQYVRPHAQATALPSTRRTTFDFQRPDIRKSLTAAVAPSYHHHQQQPDYGGQSLGSLLKAREPLDDPENAPRGIINARAMLTDPIAVGPGYGAGLPGQLPQLPAYSKQPVAYPRSKQDIPMVLYGLNEAFSSEDQKNQQALSVLRQEEIAIRQLMEQNSRDQGSVRRQQAAVQDIVHRLKDIHNRAKDVYEPSPNPNIGRYRLAQLNQIPWSIDQ